ncbi:hypothetical protein IKG06_01900 [Candidatus Saccharibacteria bacterium]|nr:hypothetical protein [Candidatus Saccharibacteria bacterium]
MESLKYYPGDDGAIDAIDRNDVRMVWNGAELGHDAFDVKPGPRYEDISGRERAGEQIIRPENVRDFGADRTEENLRMLEEIGNSQIASLYKKMLEEYPQLCVVKLVNEDENNAFFQQTTKDATTGQIMPVIRFNFSHPEVYGLNLLDTLSSKEDDSDIRTSLRYTMKMLAVRTGADWQRCARNRKMATSLAFLHEMGHAQDFIDNYLVPEYSDREEMSLGERMASSVATASNKLEAVKAEESAKYTEKLEEPFERRHRLYRDMPYEKHADKFATDYITKHYDDFFIIGEKPSDLKAAVGAKAKEALKKFAYGEDRVRVEFGYEIPMDEDFAHLMGVSRGNQIKVEPVYEPKKEPSQYDIKEGDYGLYGYDALKRFDENMNYIAAKHAPRVHEREKLSCEGKAITTLREGAPLYIREDPEKEAVRICDCTVWVRYIPSRDPESGKITNRIKFNDKGGRTFTVESLSD